MNQPAYLHFKWDFFNQVPGPNKATVSGGYFYLNGVNVTGTRDEGPAIDITQSIPVLKTTFSSGGNLYVTMDVPVGDYNAFEVKLNVVDEAHPCLVLNGNYSDGATDNTPIRIEWDEPAALRFHPQNPFSLKKKKDYTVTIGADVQTLFSATALEDWHEATKTNEDGTWTIVINATHNFKLFEDINEKLGEALIMTVQ